MISRELKSKLCGIESTGFIWLGEKQLSKKMRLTAKAFRTYYSGFKLNSLTIYEGDCVLINIGFNFGDDCSNFEVARVLECYHEDKSKIKGHVKVQWYTPLDKIKRNHLKSLPKGLPPLDGDIEVARDMWAYETVIDLETISSICCVMEVPATVSPDSVQRPQNAVGPMYVCRFEYIKSNPWVLPFTEETIYKDCIGKSFLALKDITNSPKMGFFAVVNLEEISSSLKQNTNSKILGSPNYSDGKRKVKRKLLDKEENQENLFKNIKSPLKQTENNNSVPFYSMEGRKGAGARVDSPNPEKKIEHLMTIGQCRGLEALEINDLLSDAETSQKINSICTIPTALAEENSRKSKRKSVLRSCSVLKEEGGRRKSIRKSSVITYAISSEEEELGTNSPQKQSKLKPGAKREPVATIASPAYKGTTPKGKKSLRETSSQKRSTRTTMKEVVPEIPKMETPKKLSKKVECKKKNPKSSIKEVKSCPVKEAHEEMIVNGKRRQNRALKQTKSNKTPFSKLPDRKVPVNTVKTEFEQAREQLHVSAVPAFLPCREEEFHQIHSFVEGKLLDSTGGCMYVSGVPGTGKTATIREVVRLLQECEKDGTVPPFQYLEVNAMKLTKPHQLWVQIWEGLNSQRVTADHAYSLLEKFLSTSSGPKRKSILLLLDELDLLWTRKQDVMYNLFDLSSRVDSRLIVVTIANTMDLPERMMISRVSSRLGLTRMTFQPYTFKQLQEIITSRLTGIKAFDPDAIQLVARKVAAVSGDARRALDICRRATEIAEAGKPSSAQKMSVLVGMTHVSQATSEMFSSPKISAIRRCSQMDKYILQAVMMEFTRTGIEEAVLIRVLEHLQSICRLEGMVPPSSSETLMLINGLSAQRILFTEHSRLDLMLRIRLNISTDDVSYALSL